MAVLARGGAAGPRRSRRVRSAGAGEGQLAALFGQAGLHDVEDDALWVHAEHATFEEWWEPYTLGVGPAGVYVAGLDADARAELRERCSVLMGDGPLKLSMRAWAARGKA